VSPGRHEWERNHKCHVLALSQRAQFTPTLCRGNQEEDKIMQCLGLAVLALMLLAIFWPSFKVGLFCPGIVQAGIPGFNGAMVDGAQMVAFSNQENANSQSAAGGVNFQASAASTITLTGLGNLLQQLTVGSACTVTLDSAYNICRQLPQPLTVGQTFGFQIMTNASTTVATPTLSDTAVTLAGTTSMVAAALRWYQGTITQVNTVVGMSFTAGSTFTSITQVGSTNNFTVALGTNAIVPVVGTLIYLNVTAGTLPSGWYPINKVTSATSFVIATPTGVVWTCTAATLGSGNALIPVYSPTMTITGLMTTVTATMAV